MDQHDSGVQRTGAELRQSTCLVLTSVRARGDQTRVTHVMGFMWFAVITGVGGGTVRDLILNVPVFWVQTLPTWKSEPKASAGG